MPAFTIHRPDPSVAVPLLIHVPHASDVIPPGRRAAFALTDAELRDEMSVLVDHDTDRLALGAVPLGAHVVVNRTCRLVVDPERWPDDADEPAARHGFGAVYERTVGGRPLRPAGWSPAARAALMDAYYRPYHAAVRALVLELHTRFGAPVHILDLHSYPPQPLPFDGVAGGPRPIYCLGFEPGRAPAGWLEWWERAARREPAGSPIARPLAAHNSPFAGSFEPSGLPADVAAGVRSLMIDIRRDVMPPWPTRPALPGGHDGVALVREFMAFACGELRTGADGTGARG